MMNLTELIRHMRLAHQAPPFVLGQPQPVLLEVHWLDHDARGSAHTHESRELCPMRGDEEPCTDEKCKGHRMPGRQVY